ncbi:hypothetical protein [Pseudarthrobacter sp. LT1]|uniref:hypothetical protein n=1 Tax=Pseudarthrobacter sp. LT1 TaxID=3111450 RepID=UPI002D7A2900|nr:hypothetical protein [Pseudarthrobacter sp. LT1]WRT15609.1 hypothetical protein VIK36_09085 [Pseudarthrobacter sp. LT1]
MGFLDPKVMPGNLDPLMAGKINTPGSATATALSATYAPKGLETAVAGKADAADSLTIQRLDRQGIQKARLGGGTASIAYSDAPEVTKDWADLTGWAPSANAQVSGNRLYAINGNNPGGALVSFPVAANENAHITGLLYWKAGSTTAPIYFGVDLGTAGHAPLASSPEGAYLGFNSAGGARRLHGRKSRCIPARGNAHRQQPHS